MEEILKDKRFAHIPKDPKFRRIPKNERKVKIDKRFRSMFTDKNFSVKYTVDKRGRPISQTSQENYKKFYDYSSSSSSSSSGEEDTAVNSTEETEQKKHRVEKSKKRDAKRKKNSKSKEGDKDEEESGDDEDGTANFSSNGRLILVNRSVESNEEEEAGTDDELAKNEKQLNVKKKSDKKLDESVKRKLRDSKVDYARGEGVLFTDSSSDDETDGAEGDGEDDGDEIEHAWGELDKDAESTDEATHRLAACNMDWDRIRAVDIMVLFNSFLPSDGYIKSVAVYPSEFGLRRMKEEEIKGPAELVESAKNSNGESDDDAGSEGVMSGEEDQEGSHYQREKLRKYQLNRLKYYYAVVVFDSAATANRIYEELDGREYESSSNKLDLRFIPDDETFDQEPREVCDKLPDMAKYAPRLFATTALQQVKVDLTWDETNPDRKEFAQKVKSGKVDEIDKSDLQAYLASGTSESEESEDEIKKQLDRVDKMDDKKERLEMYKSLVKSIEEAEEKKKNRDVELEFTWGLGVKEKAEQLVKEKEKMKQQENLTPFEKYVQKRKEKLKAKREERKKLATGGGKGESSDSEDSLIPSDVDMNDPYFAEEIKKNQKSKQKAKKRKNADASDADSSSLADAADCDEEEEERRRAAELELLLMDENEDGGKHHFDMKRIEEAEALTKSKRKRLNKRKKELKEEASQDNFEVDVRDPRFEALYNSHLFNIDPTDPHYRKTKGTEAFIKEKLKRRNETEDVNTTAARRPSGEAHSTEEMKPKVNTEINTLINAIKRNTKNINRCVK